MDDLVYHYHVHSSPAVQQTWEVNFPLPAGQIEKVQRQPTKILPEFQNYSYYERLSDRTTEAQSRYECKHRWT